MVQNARVVWTPDQNVAAGRSGFVRDVVPIGDIYSTQIGGNIGGGATPDLIDTFEGTLSQMWDVVIGKASNLTSLHISTLSGAAVCTITIQKNQFVRFQIIKGLESIGSLNFFCSTGTDVEVVVNSFREYQYMPRTQG
mgnify:CR=1 FL=1